jgi:hypothetical protein
MVNTPKSDPNEWKSTAATVSLKDGTKFRYRISKTHESEKPIALTFTKLSADGKEVGNLTTDSTLYFDRQGNIVDRAPMNIATSALKLKAMYQTALAEHFREFQEISVGEEALVRGFLLPGNEGIGREQKIVLGKIEKVLNHQDI